LTRISSSPEDARESIALSGSTDYVSPEQILGTAADPASDIYALGCVAYECLTGSVPFPGRSEMEVLFAHMQHEPPRPSDVQSELDRRLDNVTAKAMAKEPAERYANGAELVGAL